VAVGVGCRCAHLMETDAAEISTGGYYESVRTKHQGGQSHGCAYKAYRECLNQINSARLG
jgi:hypothetical protein